MTRREGIIKAWQSANPKHRYQAPKAEIFETEYLNYCELCDFCHEEPLTKDKWLNEPIRQKLTN